MIIPHFVQYEDFKLPSMFNFCDPFDHVLPRPGVTVTALDMAQLWGLYAGIETSAATLYCVAKINGMTVN